MSPKTARWAAALLPYVNLLLMTLAGAGLGTAARLKWDPSASIPLRLVLPQEYNVMAALLTVCPLVLLLLGVLAQAGPQSTTRRRLMLLTYAGGMVLLMVGELVTGAWLGVRVYRFATEDELVPELLGLLRVGDVVRTELNGLLNELDEFIPISELIENTLRKMSPELADLLYSADMETLLQEIPSDLPCNVYVGVACVLVSGVLQPLAALLAGLAAWTGTARDRCDAREHKDNLILSCVRSTNGLQDKLSNIPRCLRLMSAGDKVADELPLSTGRSKDVIGEHSSRMAPPRARGWRWQPGVGWTRGCERTRLDSGSLAEALCL